MLFKCSLYDPLKSDFGNFTSVDKFDTFAKVISCAKKSGLEFILFYLLF